MSPFQVARFDFKWQAEIEGKKETAQQHGRCSSGVKEAEKLLAWIFWDMPCYQIRLWDIWYESGRTLNWCVFQTNRFERTRGSHGKTRQSWKKKNQNKNGRLRLGKQARGPLLAGGWGWGLGWRTGLAFRPRFIALVQIFPCGSSSAVFFTSTIDLLSEGIFFLS